jgi:hypothetical protein
MRHTSSFNILATTLILLGAIFLLQNYGFITWVWLLWPILPLIIGTGFCMLFFRTRKDLVLLGLGSGLFLNSLFAFYLNLAGWALLAYLWPVFIIILGLTFMICFAFSRKRVLVYLSVILMALGVSFILVFAVSLILWPITLIFAGVSFIIINIFEKTIITRRVIRAKKK